jgi:hypothetical protein
MEAGARRDELQVDDHDEFVKSLAPRVEEP